jgi:hypothetical protein
MKKLGTICRVLALLGILVPIASCWLAYIIAEQFGVRLTARGPEVISIDIGGLLWNMSMLPWLLFFTVPISILLFIISFLLKGNHEN